MRLEHLVPESKDVLKDCGNLSKGHRSDLKEGLKAQISGNLSIEIITGMGVIISEQNR